MLEDVAVGRAEICEAVSADAPHDLGVAGGVQGGEE
jgi:hypothetical protein